MSVSQDFVSRYRTISLVPSWTETLIEAGVPVVGRSRFCINPQDSIKRIPAVGGTKDIQWTKVKSLDADILLLDREENTKQMAEESHLQVIDTHVESLEDLKRELNKLSKAFDNTQLSEWSTELGLLLNRAAPKWDFSEFPAALEWICPFKSAPKNFVYIIWKDPWMAVNSNTFIGSMIQQLGGGSFHLQLSNGKYPQFNLEELNPAETLLVFSSEPYPFAKKKDMIRQLGFPAVLVDGECWSWFGIRSLKFLSQQYAKG